MLFLTTPKINNDFLKYVKDIFGQDMKFKTPENSELRLAELLVNIKEGANDITGYQLKYIEFLKHLSYTVTFVMDYSYVCDLICCLSRLQRDMYNTVKRNACCVVLSGNLMDWKEDVTSMSAQAEEIKQIASKIKDLFYQRGIKDLWGSQHASQITSR